MLNQGVNKIEKLFLDLIKIKESIVKSKLFTSIARIGEIAGESIIDDGKIMLCGNGGCAADTQHLATEMLVLLRSMNNRDSIATMTLAQDTSTITDCDNDFGYEVLYERVLRSLGNVGDCLIGITYFARYD